MCSFYFLILHHYMGLTPEMQFLVHLGGHKFLSEFNNDNNSCQNTEVLVT